MSRVIPVSLITGLLCLESVFANVIVYDNTSGAQAHTYLTADIQLLANKITPTVNVTINKVTLRMARVNANQPFDLKLCSDKGGQPSDQCSNFQTVEDIPDLPTGYVTFTGTFPARAKRPFWVRMASSTAYPTKYSVGTTAGLEGYYLAYHYYYSTFVPIEYPGVGHESLIMKVEGIGKSLHADTLSGPFAYIPNAGDNTVSVINTQKNRVVRTIKAMQQIPLGAFGIALSAVADNLIITGPANIMFVGPAAARSIAQSGVPLGVNVGPTGDTVYQVNAWGAISQFNLNPAQEGQPKPDKHSLDLKTPFGIDSGHFNNDKDIHLYVTEYLGNSVAVVDAKTMSLITRISVGHGPKGITLSQDNQRAFVANHDDNTVSVIDTARHAVIGVIPVGPQPFGVAVTPAGDRLFVTNQTTKAGERQVGTVSVVDIQTLTELQRINVGRQPSGVAIDPASNRVYVANTGSNTVSVIKTAIPSPRVIKSIKVGRQPVAFGEFIDQRATAD